MKRSRPRLDHAVLLLAGWMAMGVAADTYRWTDERGGTNYSDRVPPDQVKNRRARLNARGFEIEVVDAPKTLEQLQREQLLKQLRQQQEKVLNEQRDQDRALMRTYRSADEILTALKVKLDNLDMSIKLTEASIARDRDALAAQEKRAQEWLGKSQAVPASMLDTIMALSRRIAAYREQIRRVENEKLATADQSQRDLKRFLALKAMQERNENINADWTRAVSKVGMNGNSDIIISAVECGEQAQCGRYWVLARDYLTRKTGHLLSVDTEKILQTPYPRNDTDVGITITRIPGKANDVIFMDVICRPTNIGEEFCKSSRVREVHALFRSTLLGVYPDGGQPRTDAASSYTAGP